MDAKRIGAIDIIRGVAAFFIVGNHLCLSPVMESGRLLLHYCNMFVGVFAAISGFLFARSLRTNEDMLGVWRKKAMRLLIPYFFWSLIFVLLSQAFGVIAGGGFRLDRLCDPFFVLSVIFWGDSSTHLWFLSALFYAMSLSCCIRAFIPATTQKISPWLVMSVLLLVLSMCIHTRITTYEARLFAFFFLGVAVSCSSLSDRVNRFGGLGILYALLLIAIVGHLCLATIHPFIKDYIVSLILLAIVDFKAKQPPKSNKVTDMLGEYSMGIYLVHPLFCAGLGVFIKRIFSSPYSPIAVLSDWLLSYFLAVATTCVLRYLPRMRRFVS